MATQVVSPSLALSVLTSACPTKKKFFRTRDEANQFESSNRQKYGNAQQHAYACDSCPGFHLSYQSPESYGMQASRQSIQPAVIMKKSRNGRLTKEEYLERFAFIRQMKDLNPDISMRALATPLAEKFGLKFDSAYNFIYNNWDRAANDLVPKAGRKVLPPVVVTLESIAQQRKSLEAQLAGLALEEARLIDLATLKLLPCWEGKGVLIKKEGSSFGLLLEDALDLVDKLTAYLAQV